MTQKFEDILEQAKTEVEMIMNALPSGDVDKKDIFDRLVSYHVYDITVRDCADFISDRTDEILHRYLCSQDNEDEEKNE